MERARTPESARARMTDTRRSSIFIDLLMHQGPCQRGGDRPRHILSNVAIPFASRDEGSGSSPTWEGPQERPDSLYRVAGNFYTAVASTLGELRGAARRPRAEALGSRLRTRWRGHPTVPAAREGGQSVPAAPARHSAPTR